MMIDPFSGIDAGFYLWLYPDVAAAGVDPVAHFQAHGDREGRRPNALFDPDFYRAQLAPGTDLSAGVFAHYRSVGAGLGLDPHPLFDSAFYVAQLGGPQLLGGDPLTHFLSQSANGVSPLAWFDAGFYLANNADVAAAGVNPLAHYAASGHREGRDPHPLFDLDHYLTSNADVAAVGVDPLAHFLGHGFQEGRAPHALFDADHYLAANPDVAAAGVDPLAHYAQHGWREGRAHHPLFDPAFYLASNPDVAAAGVDAFTHYMAHGWREGRDPSAAFDLDFYALANPDVAAAGWNLLVHYARFGEAEGRAFAPGQIGHDGRLRGTAGDDGALTGDGRNNLIEGFDGADVMAGGNGADTLIGGAGPDTIVVAHFGAGLDVAVGFDPQAGDALDLRPALAAAGYDPDLAPLSDFVRVRQDGGDTIVDLRQPRGPAGSYAPAIRLQSVSLDYEYLRFFGFQTAQRDEPLRFIDEVFGFTDTIFSVDSVAMTPDARYAAWADLQDVGGGQLDDLTHFANIDVASPAETQEERRLLVSVDQLGQPLAGARNAMISDDGATAGFIADDVAYLREMRAPSALPVAASLTSKGAIAPADVARLSGEANALVFISASAATNEDDNGVADVFWRDLVNGETRLVSGVQDDDAAGNGRAGGSGFSDFERAFYAPDLSEDGRFVVFVSDASLVAADDDAERDVYLRDMDTGRLILLSGGAPGEAFQPSISRDGRTVAFTTLAAYDDDDANGVYDVYVAMIDNGEMTARMRISESETGVEASPRGFIMAGFEAGGSYAPVVSPDGSSVAFMASAPDELTDSRLDDGSTGFHLLVRDLDTGQYGAPADPPFFFLQTFFADIAAPLHDLSAGGDRIVYRIPLGTEDSLLFAPVEALAPLPDVSGFRGLGIQPRDTWDGDDGDTMFLFRSDLSSGSDRDRFRIDPSSDFYDPDRLRITLEGDDRWGDGLADPLLTVRSTAGTILAQDDDISASNLNSRITLDLGDAPGGLLIDVEGAGSGDYTLRIEALGPFVIGIPPIFIGPAPIEPRVQSEPIFGSPTLELDQGLFS